MWFEKLDNILTDNWSLFSLLLVFRVVNTLVIQTAFVPDEFWQSIEVAHKWVFGYGQLTWEWQRTAAIRSPIYPLIISSFYQLAALFGWDSRHFILLFPRMLHALMAAITDFTLYRLVKKLAGDSVAKWTLFHQLANWFTFYTATRTLANSLEWFLTTLGLAACPWHQLRLYGPSTRSSQPPSLQVTETLTNWSFVLLSVLCVLVRPTSAVTWMPLCFWHLFSVAYNEWTGDGNMKHRVRRKWCATGKLLKVYLCVSLGCLTISCLIDRVCYGKWTMNQWNFLLFNVVFNGAPIYGTHPWHWYLSQGIPAMLGVQLPLAAYGIYLLVKTKDESSGGIQRTAKARFRPNNGAQMEQTFSYVCLTLFIVTVFSYSLQGHKEFRFLLPLLPYLSYLCARASHHLTESRRRINLGNLVTGIIALVHIPLVLYMCLVHQRGTLDALFAVAKAGDGRPASLPYQQADNNRYDRLNILVLAPCHSAPHLSYLHRNVSLRQLECLPDLSKWSPDMTYAGDEVDEFYARPVDWLRKEYPEVLPHYIIMFSHLIETSPALRLHLTSMEFWECGRFFHAHILTHSRYGHHVLVYCGRGTHL